MYFDNEVYFKLNIQTNYDKTVDFEEEIVSFFLFFSFHNKFTEAILVRRYTVEGSL